MECNKDEALRAKSIAEDKFTKNDFLGAKKFALKAQALYPGLDGISKMLTTLDVYVSAENKVNGETDWYGILGVDPSADEETMKKQYRKLALLLHPDKNRSVGAEGAFRIISDAWTLLSDKAKRFTYNQRRGSKSFQQRVALNPVRPGFQQSGQNNFGQAFNQRPPPMHNGVSAPLSSEGSAPSRPNGVSNGSSKKASVPKKQNTGDVKVPPPPAQTVPTHQRIDTFWTICHRCKIHFEYFKMYLNKALLCPNCRLPFLAKETSPPVVCSKPQNTVPRQKIPAPGESVRGPNGQGIHGPAAQVPAPSRAGSNSGKNPPNQRGSQSATASASSTKPYIDVKAASVAQQTRDNLKRQSTASVGSEGSVKCRKVDDTNSSKARGHEEAGNESGTTAAKSDCHEKEQHNNFCSAEKHKSTNNIELPVDMLDDQLKKSQLKDAAGVKGSEGSQDRGTSVPTPDYYDFDQDRTGNSFGDNEVWAGYDDTDGDGMPRLYALINKVVSRDPIELKNSWLYSSTNTKLSSTKSVGSGFCKSLGEFKVGKSKSCKDINSFSHRINWSKGPLGGILIIPKKGEVWALFKNFQPDRDEVIRKYEMVMVLEDYNEGEGLKVASLAKVPGFRNVFRVNSDTERVPKEEMFRFSHRVPSHVLTGENGPEGFVELDPAAIPLELLKVQT